MCARTILRNTAILLQFTSPKWLHHVPTPTDALRANRIGLEKHTRTHSQPKPTRSPDTFCSPSHSAATVFFPNLYLPIRAQKVHVCLFLCCFPARIYLRRHCCSVVCLLDPGGSKFILDGAINLKCAHGRSIFSGWFFTLVVPYTDGLGFSHFSAFFLVAVCVESESASDGESPIC